MMIYMYSERLADESYYDGNPHWIHKDRILVMYGYEGCSMTLGLLLPYEATIDDAYNLMDHIQVLKAEGKELSF